MPLYLSEQDVERLLTMEACIEAVEEGFRQWAVGTASNRPRVRARVRGGMLHVLPAASAAWGRMAVKSYASTRGGTRFVVLLYDIESSDLLAIIEADRLGQIRTGAASAVATRHLAREDARVLAVLGTGWQARGQVAAIATVRPLGEIRAYGRDSGRLTAFCGEIASGTGVRVVPATSAAEAIRGADIVTTATNSATPVLDSSWLAEGTHVNAVGSNRIDRREIDPMTVRRADLVVVDSIEQARIEAGDLVDDPADAGGRFEDDRPGGYSRGRAGTPPLERAVELAGIVSGEHPGRGSRDDITLFESLGIGLEDLAAASIVYDRAVEAGAGTSIPPKA